MKQQFRNRFGAIVEKFADLDPTYKQMFLNYQFSTHVLPTDTSDQQVLDIFRRMNATCTKLNRQELRNAEYFGEFITSVYEVPDSKVAS
jgi:hypothetical protein